MNQSMFLLVALALCALPCVLGISCNYCVPDTATPKLCNMESQLMPMNCSGVNDTCVTTKVMSSLLPNTYIFTFACLNVTAGMQTLSSYNMTACQTAINVGNATSCTSMECSMDNCNTIPVMPSPSTPTASTTAAPDTTAATTPSAGDKIHACFGLLFVALLNLV